MHSEYKIAVIGLGYVGLPLAVEFGKKFVTIGFDINPSRIDQLMRRHDETNEVSVEELSSSNKLQFTYDVRHLSDCNMFVVTVPTPIDKAKKPDLGPIKAATEMLSKIIKKEDIIIYESTVYPGVTEEECVPLLESGSGLKYNKIFF